MCTMIVEAAEIHGSGKGTQGWFKPVFSIWLKQVMR